VQEIVTSIIAAAAAKDRASSHAEDHVISCDVLLLAYDELAALGSDVLSSELQGDLLNVMMLLSATIGETAIALSAGSHCVCHASSATVHVKCAICLHAWRHASMHACMNIDLQSALLTLSDNG
jgi:hypothetical protein